MKFRRTLGASTLIHDRVVNLDGEEIGRIEELMIDVTTGRVAYAVLSHGGILGIGSKLFALPWSALTVDESKKRFVVNTYDDHAVGVMAKNDAGRLAITTVTLSPRIVFAGAEPDATTLDQMHHLAHDQCFIANSVTTQVTSSHPDSPRTSVMDENRTRLMVRCRRVMQRRDDHEPSR